MASSSQTISAQAGLRFAGRGGWLDKYFYFVMSLLVAGIVMEGFGHTVNQNLFHAAPPRPLLLWFHAAAFAGWAGFFIFQSALVRTRNVKRHRWFGWLGAGLAATMVPLGVATAIVMGRFDTHTLHERGYDAFLSVPLFDMVSFAAFFVLAILWRTKPQSHRRLMRTGGCRLRPDALGERTQPLVLLRRLPDPSRGFARSARQPAHPPGVSLRPACSDRRPHVRGVYGGSCIRLVGQDCRPHPGVKPSGIRFRGAADPIPQPHSA
jgi:hypothetical protein